MPDTTDIEKKSLEAHVELCAERYKALELQISTVQKDIDDVKIVVKEVHEIVHDMAEKRNNQLISWGLGIITFLAGIVGWLVTHYVLK
jgi:hypothetical protein